MRGHFTWWAQDCASTQSNLLDFAEVIASDAFVQRARQWPPQDRATRRWLRRRFAPAVLDQLALIALGQAAGLSLDEIQSMLSPQVGPHIDRTLLSAKAHEIDIKIRQLRAMSRGLRHAAACPAPGHAQCPTFQRLLEAAAAGALDRRRRDGSRGPEGA